MKYYLFHRAQTIQCVSIRILLIISREKGFRVWVVDVKLAYPQSDKPLRRKIFITNPAPEFDLSPHEFLQLLKPYKWLRRLKRSMASNLRLPQTNRPKDDTQSDPSLYCKFENDQIIGINGSCVDDIPRTGINERRSQADATPERFATTGNGQPPFTFT